KSQRREQMPIQVLMPVLSPTMEKGNLAKWGKSEGDKVKAGGGIGEDESDKNPNGGEGGGEGARWKNLVPGGTADEAGGSALRPRRRERRGGPPRGPKGPRGGRPGRRRKGRSRSPRARGRPGGPP